MLRRRDFLGAVGGAAGWPFSAAGQDLPLIAYLSARSAQADRPFADAFRRGLEEQGLTERQKVQAEFRWANSDPSQLGPLAADLIARRPAVIVTAGGVASAVAVKKLTSAIPIVFVTGADPVKTGLVASLNRPEANVTGVAFLATQIVAKRLDLLQEFVPKARAIAILVNPTNPSNEAMSIDVENARAGLKAPLQVFKAVNEREIDAAFADMARQHIDALLIGGDSYFNAVRRKLIALALRQSLPSMFDFREFAAEGGLMSYGTSQTDAYRQAAIYVSHILKGAKPAELPVTQSTRFELVINLSTAKALGLEVPTKLMALADEVIE
jgi:putative ABC transport system substrate-binding protein